MIYALLRYGSDDAAAGFHETGLTFPPAAFQDRISARSSVDLLPTTTSLTVRRIANNAITDGPFADMKESLIGIDIVDVPTFEEAIETAKVVLDCHPSAAACEVRAVAEMWTPN